MTTLVSPTEAVRATVPQIVQPLQVLVVDDDPDALELLACVVRSFGYRCRVASNGVDALAAMAETHADVVLSDWSMPGMSGAELCRRTRAAADDAAYTHFIFLTGFDDREHLLAAMAAGADEYQRKPVNLDELEARLVTVSDRLAAGAFGTARSAPGPMAF